MIRITITANPTGSKALLYEFPKRKGRRKFVPTFAANVECSKTGRGFAFSVTRYSSTHVFGGMSDDRYGEHGECPPCKGTPYRGITREDGPVGFRIQLFEPGFAKSETLIGRGSVERRHVQIHFGAAASHGCFLVAGRRRSYRKAFEAPLRDMLQHGDAIEVMVEDYA